jgi:tetratricopeptide (TPR) repeat protein
MAIKREQVVQTAEKYVSRGKIEPAIREYRKLLEENPNDINTLNRIGDLYARIQRIDEAVDFFNQIAEQYASEGFFVKAIAIYKKIIKLDPTRLDVYENLAELYHRQGLTTEARTQYQVLADYYQKHDNATSTIAIYQKMVLVEPANPTYHVKLAELYQQQQLIEKAMGEYRVIAELMIEHGHPQEAAQVYERALSVDCENLGFITDAALKLKTAGGVSLASRFLVAAVERNPQAERVVRLVGLAEEQGRAGGAEAPAPPAAPPGRPALRRDAAAPAAPLAPLAPIAGQVTAPPAAPAGAPPVPGAAGAATPAAAATPEPVRPAPPSAGRPAGTAPAERFAGGAGEAFEEELELELDLDLDALDLDQGPGPPAIAWLDGDAPGGGEPEPFTLVDEESAQPPSAGPAISAAAAGGGAETQELKASDVGFEEAFVLDIEDDAEPPSLVKPPPDMLAAPRRPAWAQSPAAPPAESRVAEPAAPPLSSPAQPAPPAPPSASLPPMDLAAPAHSELIDPLADLAELELINPFATLLPGPLAPEPSAAQPPSPRSPAPLERPAEAAASIEPPGEAAAGRQAKIDSALVERAADEVQPPESERYEDLVSEAEVLAKYGLEEKAIERLREAVRLKPQNQGAYSLLIQLQIERGRHGQVVKLANQLSRLAAAAGDREPWLRVRKRLLAAGFRVDGDRVVAAPLPGREDESGPEIPLPEGLAKPPRRQREAGPPPLPAAAAPAVAGAAQAGEAPPAGAVPEAVVATPGMPPGGAATSLDAAAAAAPSPDAAAAAAPPGTAGSVSAPGAAAAAPAIGAPSAAPRATRPRQPAGERGIDQLLKGLLEVAAPKRPLKAQAPPAPAPPPAAPATAPPTTLPAAPPAAGPVAASPEASPAASPAEVAAAPAEVAAAPAEVAAAPSGPSAPPDPAEAAPVPSPEAVPPVPELIRQLEPPAPPSVDAGAAGAAAAEEPWAPPGPAETPPREVFNPLEIGAMVESEELDWESEWMRRPGVAGAPVAPPAPSGGPVPLAAAAPGAAPSSGRLWPGAQPGGAAPSSAARPAGPPARRTPSSGGQAPSAWAARGSLDDSGMSWLDQVESGRYRKGGKGGKGGKGEEGAESSSLFDEEDDFFDLAGELEQELSREAAFQGEEPLVQQGEQSLEEIVEGFKKGVAEQLSPTDYDTHFNLGIAYREMGLLDEAIGEFQLAAKDAHYLVSCCSMLGLCFLDKGLPELAIKWYRRGLEAPNVGEDDTLGLLYDLGCAYLTSGDHATAYKTFVEAYGINTNYRDVVARIEELGRLGRPH